MRRALLDRPHHVATLARRTALRPLAMTIDTSMTIDDVARGAVRPHVPDVLASRESSTCAAADPVQAYLMVKVHATRPHDALPRSKRPRRHDVAEMRRLRER